MSWWTVDPFTDRIIKREERPREFGTPGIEGTRRFFVFDNEHDAMQFLVERCERELSKSLADIPKLERRLKRHRSRLIAASWREKV